MQLTKTQKRYIWLAGSFPKLVVRQGRGYRRPYLMYGLDDAAEEMIIFGYGDPFHFLEVRGIFRKLQSGGFVLTEEGEAAFRKMQLRGDGADLNQECREVRLKKVA
jgi:hypothetical protein